MVVFSDYGSAKDYTTITTNTVAQYIPTVMLNYPTVEGLMGLRVKAALVTVEGGSINFTMDGTTPTTTASTNLGHTLVSNDSILITDWENVKNFQWINSVASSGVIVKITTFA